MQEIQNVVVKQDDILDLLNSLKQYYDKKQAIFNETESLVEEEERRYKEWGVQRRNSDDFFNYPPFERQTFHNKGGKSKLTVDIWYVDGTRLYGKPADEFLMSLDAKPFATIESVTIDLSIYYYKNYKDGRAVSYDEDSVSQSVKIRFGEEDVSYSVSGENCDAEVMYLKSVVEDKFRSFEPKLSDIITKRSSIKFKATLGKAFVISALLVVLLSYLAKNYLSIDISGYKIVMLVGYLVVAFLINPLIPPLHLSRLYSIIEPRKVREYSSYDRHGYDVDDFKSYARRPEIQIGKFAKKAGVREEIKEYISKQRIKNILGFAIGAIVVVVSLFVL